MTGDGGATASVLEGLMSDCGTVLSEILSLATDVLDWIVSNPLTLLTFILTIIGLAIGLVMKFRRA